MKNHVAAAAIILAWWPSVSATASQEPLPEAPEDAPFSSYSPPTPYDELAVGILLRPISDNEVDGLRVRVIDLLIGPGQTSDPVALIGQSTHLVLSGSGVITFGTPTGVVTRPIVPGSSFQFSPANPFQIANTGTIPVDIRVRIVTVAGGA